MSTPQTVGEKYRNVRGNIGRKDKTSLWHLIGFPDGSNIGSINIIVSGRNPPSININRHAGTPSTTKTKDTMSLGAANFCYIDLESDGCQHDYIAVLLGDKVLLSDNYQENLTAGTYIFFRTRNFLMLKHRCDVICGREKT